MKRRNCIALFLAVLMLASMLSVTAHAKGYSTVSTKGTELEFPSERDFRSTVSKATVKATRARGSIYIMPMPESGHGNLGTVKNGETVYIVAKHDGYYFFVTEDGYMGWNGTKYFTLKGTADYEEVSDAADHKYELYDYAPEYYYFLDYLYSIFDDT